MKALWWLLFALAAGCGDRERYEFGRDLGRGKADCQALTVPDERARCEAEFEQDFETYKRERNEL